MTFYTGFYMRMQPEATWIEKLAQGLGLIPDLTESVTEESEMLSPGPLNSYPPPEKWDDWEEYEATGWSRKKKNAIRSFPLPVSIVNQAVGC